MIAQFEQGRKKRPLKMSLSAIRNALTAAGVVFKTDEDGTEWIGLRRTEDAE